MKDPRFYRMYGYDLAVLPNKRLQELERDVPDLETARTRSGASIGYPGWGLIYQLALCSLDPDRFSTVVETGTNHGCSSIVLAQAIKDRGVGGVLHTIEIDEETAGIARGNIAAAGVGDLVEQHVGASLEVLPGLLDTLPEINLAFLDGSHLMNDALTEFELVLPKLSPGALVVFDNTYEIAEPHEDPRVHGALKEIIGRGEGNLINLPYVSWYTPGVAIWQKAPF